MVKPSIEEGIDIIFSGRDMYNIMEKGASNRAQAGAHN